MVEINIFCDFYEKENKRINLINLMYKRWILNNRGLYNKCIMDIIFNGKYKKFFI